MGKKVLYRQHGEFTTTLTGKKELKPKEPSPPPTAIPQEVLESVRSLRGAIEEATHSYVRSTPFVTGSYGSLEVAFDIKDILLLGAITHSDVLLIGRTGSGKTKLANMTMEALFGKEGYYSKTTLPSMSPTDFMDIDFPAIRKADKSLKEAISGVPALTRPGIVVNEANRAPELVQAMLIPFLDREFEIEGKPMPIGVEHGKERYQYRILTINEGKEYVGVREMDRAIRDRTVIEVVVDIFPQTGKDILDMLTLSPSLGEDPRGHLDQVLELYDHVREIPLDPQALLFITYLAGLSNCLRSPTGNKEGMEDFGPALCSGCHQFRHFYNICGNILAPSPRALNNLRKVAQGLALLRVARANVGEMRVAVEDVITAGPLVLLSKMDINPLWLKTAGPKGGEYRGCKWKAIQDLLKFLLEDRFRKAPRIWERYVRGENLSRQELSQLTSQVEKEDLWLANLEQLEQRKKGS